MLTVSPVIHPASSDARNVIRAASSSAFPTRPIGCVVLLRSRNAAYFSSSSPAWRCSPVTTTPVLAVIHFSGWGVDRVFRQRRPEKSRRGRGSPRDPRRRRSVLGRRELGSGRNDRVRPARSGLVSGSRVEKGPAFRSSKPKVLFEGPFATGFLHNPNYTVSPDGQKFVMIQDVQSPHFEIVLNWANGLER